ncbi:MAG: Hsp70 family protein, partial [bacterium]|nr:Hsp70 family protein [bacterium]
MRNTTTPHQETGIVGIDLGTTNSALSIYKDGKVTVISIDGHPLLPSCVGLDPQNEVVVGYPALNQYILFPERTVKSIKRRMGTTDTIVLGKESFLPEEISAIILGHLKKKAEEVLGMPIPSAVITVPAYFSDTQRKATHAAGEIAGFKVERIINEPTAAALAFRHSSLAADKPGGEISVVYDLGGGTFDVSIVREEQALTEVLASHGDTHLGGDDFDQLLCDHFLHHLHKNYTESLRDNRQVMNRLLHAAETCKIQLSDATYFRVMEEDLLPGSKKPMHLDLEVSRIEFEEMIHAHIDRTIDCIEQAMKDAKISPSQ